MKSRWKNIDALVTGFDGTDSENNLADIIVGSKFMKRAKEKGMAKIQDANESHITTRSPHMEQAAIQAKKLAHKLGLNETVAYIGMMMHDAGHTFSSHEGEYAMNKLGELENIGYYHHSAKGLYTVINEDFISSFVDQIPDANEELKKKLREEVWYFFELIVGHDGESTKKDNEKTYSERKKYSNIKEAVLSKAAKANRTDNYKCAVETLEAQLAKPADILAYLKSDVLDAFSQGLITEFSDKNLILIGELLCETNEETEEINRKLDSLKSKEIDADKANEKENTAFNKYKEKIDQERIKRAKEYVNKIKVNHLRENAEDIDEECVDIVKEIMNRFEENGIIIEKIKKSQYKNATDIETDEINKFINKMRADRLNKNVIKAQVNKVSDYLVKMQKTRKRVVEEIIDNMQDTLLDDYAQNTLKEWQEIEKEYEQKIKEIENSEEENKEKIIKELKEERYYEKMKTMDFSKKGNEIIYGEYGMKRINYLDYVQYAKKEYQTGVLPSSVYKLIMKSAKVIVKTGIIRNKFFDPKVFEKIEDKDLLSIMHKNDIEFEENEKYKQKHGFNEEKLRITEPKKEKKKYTGFKNRKKIEQLKLYRDIYRNIQRQEPRFSNYCEDVYYAIPYTVKQNVKNALDPEYELNEYLADEDRRKIDQMRVKIYNYIGEMKPTKELMQNFINEEIESERSKLEEKVAILLCRDYIAGMSDVKIKDVLLKTGILSKRRIQKEDKPSGKGNKKIQELSNKLAEEDKEK